MKGYITHDEKTNTYRVRFGRKIHRRFKTQAEAERFLNRLRVQSDDGLLDTRDYQKDQPLSIGKLSSVAAGEPLGALW